MRVRGGGAATSLASARTSGYLCCQAVTASPRRRRTAIASALPLAGTLERGSGLNAVDQRESDAQPGCLGEREPQDVVGGRRIVDSDDADRPFAVSTGAQRVSRPDHHDRARCMGRQVTAYGADQQPGEAAEATRADDHKLSVLGFGEHHRFSSPVTSLAVDSQARGARGGPSGSFVDDSFGDRAQAAVGRAVWRRPQRHVREERPDEGVDYPEPAMPGGARRPPSPRRPATLGAVDADEDRLPEWIAFIAIQPSHCGPTDGQHEGGLFG